MLTALLASSNSLQSSSFSLHPTDPAKSSTYSGVFAPGDWHYNGTGTDELVQRYLSLCFTIFLADIPGQLYNFPYFGKV